MQLFPGFGPQTLLSSKTAMLTAGALGAIGNISQGQAAGAQSEYQAKVGEQQAARERKVAASEEEDFRRKQSRILAERRAAMGKSGVELGTGTPLLAASDFAAETELNALRIRAGGETQAIRKEQEAELARMAGRSAQQRGYFRGGASLLSGYAGAFK